MMGFAFGPVGAIFGGIFGAIGGALFGINKAQVNWQDKTLLELVQMLNKQQREEVGRKLVKALITQGVDFTQITEADLKQNWEDFARTFVRDYITLLLQQASNGKRLK